MVTRAARIAHAGTRRARAHAERVWRTSPLRFLRRLTAHVIAHEIDDVAAMLAYYTVLSAFPMLVFVATVAILLLPRSALLQGVAMVADQLPAAVHQLIDDRVDSLIHASTTGFAVGTAVFALWGASRGAVALMRALGRLSGRRDPRSWLRRQLVALAVTLGVALFLIVALALLVAGPVVGHWVAEHFGLDDTFELVWAIGRWVGAALLVLAVWAAAYRFLPCPHPPFRVFTPGALVALAAWLGISRLFQLYLSYWNSYDKIYGALGGGIILLTWIWLTNMAFLLGAEINAVAASAPAPPSSVTSNDAYASSSPPHTAAR